MKITIVLCFVMLNSRNINIIERRMWKKIGIWKLFKLKEVKKKSLVMYYHVIKRHIEFKIIFDRVFTGN